jgi:Ni,Fe-hydrogenase III large subunit
VARACGITLDARRDQPFCDDAAQVDVASRVTGDVLARFQVRVDEFDASITLLRTLLEGTKATRARAELPLPRNSRSGVGIVEGWRGAIVHRVEIGDDGLLTRAKIVDPSFLNWPALSAALADTIVPDFPLANKSFNLSYAGNDL